MATPPHIAALMAALRFTDARPGLLHELSDAEWKQLLAYSDIARLTLLLARVPASCMPAWVIARLERNLADNAERLARAEDTYHEVAQALAAAHAPHLVLKGFAQWPWFVPDLRLRTLADLDLYCPPDSVYRAYDALVAIGYEPFPVPENGIADHLPPLVRPRAQTWRGNPFDPGISLAVELHNRFWGRRSARFGPSDLDAFWARRVPRQLRSVQFHGLNPLDAFAHTALHALRHLLYGGLAPWNIYEIAYFLDQNFANDALWRDWLLDHPESLRIPVAACALLAVRWFGCRLPEAVEQAIVRLPASIPRWYERFGDSTLVHLFKLNKDALWLQAALAGSARDKAAVVIRRLFPLWVPRMNSPLVQEVSGGKRRAKGGMGRGLMYANWFGTRIARHLRLLPYAVWSGVRLWYD